MINHLTNSAANFIKKYHSEGASVLTECHLVPEFQELVEIVKEIGPEHFGMKQSNYGEFFKKNSISYLKIVESTEISIGVFYMSKGTYAFSFCFFDFLDPCNYMIIQTC
jgi:hypothetical protein